MRRADQNGIWPRYVNTHRTTRFAISLLDRLRHEKQHKPKQNVTHFGSRSVRPSLGGMGHSTFTNFASSLTKMEFRSVLLIIFFWFLYLVRMNKTREKIKFGKTYFVLLHWTKRWSEKNQNRKHAKRDRIRWMVEWKVAVATLEAGHKNNIESLIGLHAKVTAHANVISCASTECS